MALRRSHMPAHHRPEFEYKFALELERYVHLDNDPLRRASKLIGRQFAAAMGKTSYAHDNVHLTMDDTNESNSGYFYCGSRV
jgi:hypothetical protein